MTSRTVISLAFLGLLISCQAGCSLGYNGAWLMTSEDKKTFEEYQKFVAERESGRTRAESEDRIRAQSPRFVGTGGGQRLTPLAQSERIVSPASLKAASKSAVVQPRPRDKRFLYGQLHHDRHRIASPMDGTANLQQITFATEGADYDPSLDQTGGWLVYASTQHRDRSDLYIKAVDGTAIRQLTDDPANDATPTFSPDGKWIAYSSDRTGNWDIYLVSVDGGPSRQITRSPNDDIHPSFSPDGTKLTYCTLGSRAGQWELVVVDLDNPATPRFIGHGLFPRWSPTDARIVYQRAREKGSRYFGVWTIELVNGEGMRPTQIASSSNAAAITPSWSPDGKGVVFCTIVNPESDEQQGTPVQSDVWVINTDGTGRTNLTRSRFMNLQPSWAPDGSIYFVSNRGQKSMENIWAIRTETAINMVRTASAPVPPRITQQIQLAEVPTTEQTQVAEVPTEQ